MVVTMFVRFLHSGMMQLGGPCDGGYWYRSDHTDSNMADHYNRDTTITSHTKGEVRWNNHFNRTYAVIQVCLPSGGVGQSHCHCGVVGVPSR